MVSPILTLVVLALIPTSSLLVINTTCCYAFSFVHTKTTRTDGDRHREFTFQLFKDESHKFHYNYSTTRRKQQRSSNDGGDLEEEAAKLRRKAEELRSQIRDMENKLGNDRLRRPLPSSSQQSPPNTDTINDGDVNNKKSLKDKRILIVGANGRLGSMVTRHLLRSHPEVKEVVAAVHYVGQSSTTRGYGRLSYEVGAEDGIGTIGPAWDEESNASFMFDSQVMSTYNINKLRIVEVELLNPTQVRTIIDNVDSIIFCATDFDGNRPKSIASLDVSLLFRAVADPTKGRVEIEGLRNCLEGLVANRNDRRWQEEERRSNNDEPGATATIIIPSSTTNKKKNGMPPTQFVLISTCPDAYGVFETPYGEFNGLKRQGERLVMEDFPSITCTVLQMGKYDDNFIPEGQELLYEMAIEDTAVIDGVITAIKQGVGGGGTIVKDGMQKRINRRDAARAAVEALLSEDIQGKKVQVYTAVRKTDIW
jgi:nucleoside-diphosphate-sugar epimerase